MQVGGLCAEAMFRVGGHWRGSMTCVPLATRAAYFGSGGPPLPLLPLIVPWLNPASTPRGAFAAVCGGHPAAHPRRWARGVLAHHQALLWCVLCHCAFLLLPIEVQHSWREPAADTQGMSQKPLPLHTPLCTIPISAPPPCSSAPAGSRFPAEMQRLQGELWDDDMSLDLESMQDQHLKVGFNLVALWWLGCCLVALLCLPLEGKWSGYCLACTCGLFLSAAAVAGVPVLASPGRAALHAANSGCRPTSQPMHRCFSACDRTLRPRRSRERRPAALLGPSPAAAC